MREAAPALLVACLAFQACTANPSADPAATPSAAEAGAAAAMSVEDAGAPGEHHPHLLAYVGTWHATLRMPGADEPFVEEGGVMVTTWDMGGRFLRHSFTGESMGQPFEGRGFTGYDNLEGRYESVWMGDNSTDMAYSTGVCSDHGRTLTMRTKQVDPAAGVALDVVDVLVVESADRHTFTRSMLTPEGEQVMFEIVYERR